MLVEARRAEEAEALHDGEARSIDNGEIVVRKRFADCERHLEIGETDGLDGSRAAADCIPVRLGRASAQAVREQQPGLDEHVVACHEPFAARQDLLRALITSVAAVGGGVEDRAVDEKGQRADSPASPT
jgi:hypothetical protein